MSELQSEHVAHNAVLVERKGRFFFHQPGLGVIASGSSVSDAYESFVAARQAFLDDIEKAGLTPGQDDSAERPSGGAASRGIVAELGLFLAKTCIVLVVIGVMVQLVVSGISRSVEQLAASVTPRIEALATISMSDVATKAADIARDAQQMPDDRKKMLRESVAAISREVLPVIEAWRNPPSATGSAGSLPGR